MGTERHHPASCVSATGILLAEWVAASSVLEHFPYFFFFFMSVPQLSFSQNELQLPACLKIFLFFLFFLTCFTVSWTKYRQHLLHNVCFKPSPPPPKQTKKQLYMISTVHRKYRLYRYTNSSLRLYLEDTKPSQQANWTFLHVFQVVDLCLCFVWVCASRFVCVHVCVSMCVCVWDYPQLDGTCFTFIGFSFSCSSSMGRPPTTSLHS